jgi:hypothetical protein
MRSIIADLMPASGHQDHTTSPSASGAFVKALSASTASHPNVRDDGQRPSPGTGRRNQYNCFYLAAKQNIFALDNTRQQNRKSACRANQSAAARTQMQAPGHARESGQRGRFQARRRIGIAASLMKASQVAIARVRRRPPLDARGNTADGTIGRLNHWKAMMAPERRWQRPKHAMHKLQWVLAFLIASLSFLPEAAGVCRARSASSQLI